MASKSLDKTLSWTDLLKFIWVKHLLLKNLLTEPKLEASCHFNLKLPCETESSPLAWDYCGSDNFPYPTSISIAKIIFQGICALYFSQEIIHNFGQPKQFLLFILSWMESLHIFWNRETKRKKILEKLKDVMGNNN